MIEPRNSIKKSVGRHLSEVKLENYGINEKNPKEEKLPKFDELEAENATKINEK